MVRLIVHTAVIGLLVAALAVFTWFDNEVNRGVTYTSPDTPIPWADVPQIGVNAYNLQFEPNPADVTRTLELARAMGAHFVRIQMPGTMSKSTAKAILLIAAIPIRCAVPGRSTISSWLKRNVWGWS